MAEPNIDDDIKAVPLKHYGRWVFGGLLLLGLVALCWSIATSPNIDGAVFFKFVFHPLIIDGAITTVWITALSMVIATILATLLAVMRLSSNPLLKAFSMGFVSFFRGTPLLLQIVFWGYLGLIWPQTRIGIPFTDIVFVNEKPAA